MGEPEIIPTEPTEPIEPAPAPAPEVLAREYYGTGRRKNAVARVFLRPGSGKLEVNGRSLDDHFKNVFWRKHAREPLEQTELIGRFDLYATVRGGGMAGQSGAVRLGVARALVSYNPELRAKLRKEGFLTRDPRVKERKKYGQKGARKRFQYSKR